VTFLRDAQADSVIIATKQSTSGRLLPILHALQEEFGYIDEAAELLIAEALNITRAEAHGVITFYHIRAPAGPARRQAVSRRGLPTRRRRPVRHTRRGPAWCADGNNHARWRRHARAGLLRRRTAPASC
jgi:Thioredoxin-like [2Fe-2S] ferredoxin